MANCCHLDHDGGMTVRHRTLQKRHKSEPSPEIKLLQRELAIEKAARKKAEARVQELEDRLEAMEQELKSLRKGRWETEEFLQRKIKQLEKDVADRDEKLEEANKQLDWFRREYFTSNPETVTEKGKDETETQPEQQDEQIQPKRKRGQQRGSKGPPRSDRSQLQSDEEEIEIPNCVCPDCGTPYLKLATKEPSPLTEIQICLLLMLYQRCKYVSQCDCHGKQIVTAPPPPKLYKRTTIGNSLWLHLLVQKYLHQVPTNRTLKDLSLLGLPLSPGTVTGGFQVINRLVDPLYQAMIDRCRGADLWNADESTWRVFDSNLNKWWLWVIASQDAVVYVLDPSRSKKVPTAFFAGSVGLLMTDRLSSYKGLHDGIRKAWCWVHQRRDFFNVYKGVPKLKQWAEAWLRDMAELFVLNHKRFKVWQSGRWSGLHREESQAQLVEHIQKLERRWTAELAQPNLHKKQKTILTSMKNHWAGLTIFLHDPRIPLENNRAERLLRNCVVLRKNSYGSGSEWSGHMAAKIFSIFQTWLINGLDPQAMLLAYFDECSKTPGRAPPDVSDFLPWKMSEERKRLFQLPKSYKQPG